MVRAEESKKKSRIFHENPQASSREKGERYLWGRVLQTAMHKRTNLATAHPSGAPLQTGHSGNFRSQNLAINLDIPRKTEVA